MTVQGVVQGGVVVVPGGLSLPEGTPVSIIALEHKQSSEPGDASIPIGKKLADLAKSLESLPCDLPSDLAANHDHYLHGLPKRQ
jgi:hypothetical protein